MDVFMIIEKFICLVLMIVDFYLAFKAKQKDDLNEMVWNLSFMILMSTCIGQSIIHVVVLYTPLLAA